MFDDPLFYVAAAACLVVAGILLFGIGGFGKGGDFNKKHANKVMRFRLYAQLAAVALMVGFILLRGAGGQ